MNAVAAYSAAGVRKPPGEETAGKETLVVRRGYGDLGAADDVRGRWRDAGARWLMVPRLMDGRIALLNGGDVRAI